MLFGSHRNSSFVHKLTENSTTSTSNGGTTSNNHKKSFDKKSYINLPKIPDHTKILKPNLVKNYHDLLIVILCNLENSSNLNYYLMKLAYNFSYFIKNLSKNSSWLFFNYLYNRDDNTFVYLIIENILQYQFDSNSDFILMLLEHSDEILNQIELKDAENPSTHLNVIDAVAAAGLAENDIADGSQIGIDHAATKNIKNATLVKAINLLKPQLSKFKNSNPNVKESDVYDFLKSSTLVGLLPERRTVDLYDLNHEIMECQNFLYGFMRGKF